MRYTVVITVTPVTFVFIEGDDVCICHVCGHCILSPTWAKKFVEVAKKWAFGRLDDF